jgi:hypothetical protein
MLNKRIALFFAFTLISAQLAFDKHGRQWMANIFAILFFLSVAMMIIGLTKPAVLESNSETPITRRKIVVTFSSLLLSLLILITLTIPKNKTTTSSEAIFRKIEEKMKSHKAIMRYMMQQITFTLP